MSRFWIPLLAVALLLAASAGVSEAGAQARVVMGCERAVDGQFVLSRLEAQPDSCGNIALGGTSAGFRGVHWQGWGKLEATGSGYLIDGLGFEYPATFTVYRLEGSGGAQFYSRMLVVSKGGVRGDAFRPGLNRTVSVAPVGLAASDN